MTMLRVDALDAHHGLLHAVRDVSLEVAEGEILALIGANGAGKTTLLRAIAGAHPPTRGRVLFDGADITMLPAHRRVRKGLALVPEGRRLFSGLTVEENLLVAGAAARPGPWNASTVLEVFPLLRERRHALAANLSGGEQQAAAIGRALMTNPQLLLLDEVSLGLAPVAVETLYRSLQLLIERSTTIVIVEQDLDRALKVSSRIVCLLEGRITLEGRSRDITRNEVTGAYFGLRGAKFAEARVS
ncbi:MAG: ABC transporter ATP-binding protein [Bradyrhizobiaceae bacterium]|nr:ABC transporter ATP-binding protein [Bradyrhizobiaceae bacterium]